MFSSILFRLFALFLFITFCLNYCSTTNIVCSSYRYRYWHPQSSNAKVNVQSTLCLPPLPALPKEKASLAESEKSKVKTQLLTTSASTNEQTKIKTTTAIAIPENLMSESIHFEDDNESGHTGENNFFNENYNRNKNTFYGGGERRRLFDENFQRTNKPDSFHPRFTFPISHPPPPHPLPPSPSYPNPSLVYFPKETSDLGYNNRNHGDNSGKKNKISTGGLSIRPLTNIEISNDNLNNDHQNFNDNGNKNQNKNDENINKNNHNDEHSNDKNRGKQHSLNNRNRDRNRNKDFSKTEKNEEKQPGNGNDNHGMDENDHDINKNTAVNKNPRELRRQYNRYRDKQRNYKKEKETNIEATTIRSIISRNRSKEKLPVIDINDENNHDHDNSNNNKNRDNNKNDNVEINHNYDNKKLSYPKNLHANDIKSIITKGSNAFGFKLFRSLIKKDENENIILSPFSLYSLLIILYSGSDGSTRTEFENILQLNNVEKNELEKSFMHLKENILGEIQSLKLLNLFVVNNKFKILSDFSDKVNNFYKAQLYSANFLSEGEDIKNRINYFVNNATDGKIKQVLRNKPSTSTKLFVLNSILFKDKWLEKFNPELTELNDFRNLDGSTSKVNMMRGSMEIHLNCEIEPYKYCTVRLPYLVKNISMILMIPDKSENLNDLSNSLNEDLIHSAISKLEHKTREFGLPKFELTGNVDIQKILEENGLRKIFNPNEANLSHMTNSRYLYVRKIKHQSIIEVNEEGTSAASTSYAFLDTRRSPSKFYINKPFIFLIKDLETNLILFIGRVNHLAV